MGYFSYTYSVGGENYEGEVRRTGPLVRARVGDSVRVRYLPDAPARHTLVRDGEGNVRFSRGLRPDRGSPDGRNDLLPGEKPAEKRKFLALGL